MKLYLSGGMQSFGKENFDESNIWRKHIVNYCNEFYPNFIQCFNPNDYFSFLDEEPQYESQREVMEFDLYHLRSSDVILVNFNDPHSLGTQAEIAIAYEMKKPIIGINDNKFELHPWQIEMCNRIFVNGYFDAIEYIVNMYL